LEENLREKREGWAKYMMNIFVRFRPTLHQTLEGGQMKKGGTGGSHCMCGRAEKCMRELVAYSKMKRPHSRPQSGDVNTEVDTLFERHVMLLQSQYT
jgi:hypothetical protein